MICLGLIAVIAIVIFIMCLITVLSETNGYDDDAVKRYMLERMKDEARSKKPAHKR